MRKRGMRPYRRLRGYALEAYAWAAQSVALRGVAHARPILVYQMGKVGSSTVVETLERLKLGRPVLHVHTLSPEHLALAVQRQRRSGRPYLPEHLIVSAILTRKLRHGLFPCDVITLTREPIARAISFVFEDHSKQVPGARRPDGRVEVGTVMQALERLLTSENGIADPTRWFDQELRACLGTDVFTRPYDLERGYTIVEGGVRTLVMRLEDLNRSLVPALSEYLDLPAGRIALHQANVGEAKWYSDALRQVKEQFRMAPASVEAMLNTRYCRHFYAAEAERLRARWISSAIA